MIDTLYFGIGFVIYLGFLLATFKTISYRSFSKMINQAILFFIYVFYTILAGYVIRLVDYTGNNGAEIMVQVLIYMVAGGFSVYMFYNNYILTSKKEKIGDE